MKRWAMLFVAVMTTAVLAQGREFSGSWVLDVEKSGSKQGPPVMTVVPHGEGVQGHDGRGRNASRRSS
jgi:hypothetical protein